MYGLYSKGASNQERLMMERVGYWNWTFWTLFLPFEEIYRVSHNYLDWDKYQNRHSSKIDEAVLLPKSSPDWTIILAKYQHGHSNTL